MGIVSLLMEVSVQRQISLMECVRLERSLVRQAKDEKAELCRRMRLQKSRGTLVVLRWILGLMRVG